MTYIFYSGEESSHNGYNLLNRVDRPTRLIYVIGGTVILSLWNPSGTRTYTVSCKTLPNLADWLKVNAKDYYLYNWKTDRLRDTNGGNLQHPYPFHLVVRSEHYLVFKGVLHRLNLTPLPLSTAETFFIL